MGPPDLLGTHFGIIFDNFGTILGSFWDQFGGPLGCFGRSLECLGVALGSHLAALGRSWGGLWCLGFDAGVLWVSERSARASEASEARGATRRSQRGETLDKKGKVAKHLTPNLAPWASLGLTWVYVGVLGHAGPGAQRGETVEKQNKFGKHLTSNFVFLVLSGPSALLRFTGCRHCRRPPGLWNGGS